ncbi:MAG: FAD-dependent oxidoreductase [Silicimonas sp.]|nr:FAD-dependent oxidoreductase [Silicimonas sp.]
MSPPTDPLLSPFTLKGLQLRNRVMSTSHACGLEEGGFPQDAYQRYHEEKAKGGIGLTMFGGSSNVAPDSPSVFQQLNVGTDEIVPHLQRFSERIHAQGAGLMCQITHLGRRGDPHADNWLPTVAPSPIRETLHRSFPKEMDRHDIDRIVKAYGAAARRCKEGGLDGIETLASSHLIGQFLSPYTNTRTDDFGGSIENRCRFGLMVQDEIRAQVGDDFIVGLRYVVEEGSGGMPFDECLEIAHIFERQGKIDFFNAIYGRMDTERGLAVDNMPGMASPIAPWLKTVGAFKQEVGLPVFHAARISDIATARYAIREGLLDLVAMTRAHIADPHIVQKMMDGQENRIRPCVGATHCMTGFRPRCLHNAASGQENKLPHVATPGPNVGKKVVVIGGGPAGLEAARICGERGHQVVLFEAAAVLGGQVRIAAGSWRKDLIGIVDWRAAELEELGVDVRLNTFAEAPDVLNETPDVVIVATGGVPDIDWIDGAELCATAWDVLTGAVALEDDIIVYDGTGRNPAIAAAELAAQAGKSVSLVALDGSFGPEMTYSERVSWKQRQYDLNIPVSLDLQLTQVRRDANRLTATFVNEMTGQPVDMQADQIVVERGTLPADEVFHDLRSASRNDGVTDIDCLLANKPQPLRQNSDGAFELHRVGDSVSSRNIYSAILDAVRLCNSI